MNKITEQEERLLDAINHIGDVLSEGIVRWRDLVSVCSVTATISLGALYLHSEQPHKNAVSQREFNRVVGKLKNIESRLIRLNEILIDSRQSTKPGS